MIHPIKPKIEEEFYFNPEILQNHPNIGEEFLQELQEELNISVRLPIKHIKMLDHNDPLAGDDLWEYLKELFSKDPTKFLKIFSKPIIKLCHTLYEYIRPEDDDREFLEGDDPSKYTTPELVSLALETLKLAENVKKFDPGGILNTGPDADPLREFTHNLRRANKIDKAVTEKEVPKKLYNWLEYQFNNTQAHVADFCKFVGNYVIDLLRESASFVFYVIDIMREEDTDSMECKIFSTDDYKVLEPTNKAEDPYPLQLHLPQCRNPVVISGSQIAGDTDNSFSNSEEV